MRLWRFLIGSSLILGPAPALALGNAAPDLARQFDAVVTLRSADTPLCTAVKLGPRTLLTAAHCVVDSTTGTLKPSFEPGGQVNLDPGPEQSGRLGGVEAVIASTKLPETYQRGLARYRAYRKRRLSALEAQTNGLPADLLRERLRMRHHFAERYPDIALLQVTEALPAIPSLEVDFGPVDAGTEVVLIGFGCGLPDQDGRSPAIQRRTGRSRVIRVDAVNFYTEASQRQERAPSLCAGDSGGPVLRAGRVVGIHTGVYGLNARHGARSNMAVNLAPLADWDAWPR